MQQVLGLGLGVGPDVEHDEVAFAPRHDGGEGGAFGAFHRAHLDRARGHEGLGVAGRDHHVGLAGLEHLEGLDHRGIALGLEHGHRRVVHRDGGGGVAVEDAVRLVQDTVFPGQKAEVVLVAHEDQGIRGADDALLEGEGGGGDGFGGTEVTAHAIEGDPVTLRGRSVAHEVGRGPGRSLGSGVEDLTTAVLPRGGVDAVGAAEGAGFGVLDELRGAELVGAATETAATLGLFTFRIGHGSALG